MYGAIRTFDLSLELPRPAVMTRSACTLLGRVVVGRGCGRIGSSRMDGTGDCSYSGSGTSGAIPLGLALGLPVPTVLLLSYIGNLIPVPFILLGIGWVMNRLRQIPAIHAWLEDKAAKGGDKLHDSMQKWGWLGLLIFVAIPLPGTGAWTGALAASVLRLPFWPSLLSIAGGNYCWNTG